MQDNYGMAGALLMPDSLTHALTMEEKADPGVATRPPADPEARFGTRIQPAVGGREGSGSLCGYLMSSMRMAGDHVIDVGWDWRIWLTSGGRTQSQHADPAICKPYMWAPGRQWRLSWLPCA